MKNPHRNDGFLMERQGVMSDMSNLLPCFAKDTLNTGRTVRGRADEKKRGAL